MHHFLHSDMLQCSKILHFRLDFNFVPFFSDQHSSFLLVMSFRLQLIIVLVLVLLDKRKIVLVLVLIHENNTNILTATAILQPGPMLQVTVLV